MAIFKKRNVRRQLAKASPDAISAATKKPDSTINFKSKYGPPTSQAGKGPSSDYAERQGQKTETKSPPNKFPVAKVPEKKAETFGEAFKAARAAGKGPFNWTNPKTGKSSSYSTDTKEEAAAKAKPKVEAIPEKGNESKRKVLPEVEVTAPRFKPVRKIDEVVVYGKKPVKKTAKFGSKVKKNK